MVILWCLVGMTFNKKNKKICVLYPSNWGKSLDLWKICTLIVGDESRDLHRDFISDFKTVLMKTETPRGHPEISNRQQRRTTSPMTLRGSAYSKTHVRLTSHADLFWPFVSISGDHTLSMCWILWLRGTCKFIKQSSCVVASLEIVCPLH